MIITFSKHAVKRMIQRNVSEQLVLEILESPDEIVRDEDQIKAMKRVRDKIVIIVYKEDLTTRFIITVISSSKIGKYGPGQF